MPHKDACMRAASQHFDVHQKQTVYTLYIYIIYICIYYSHAVNTYASILRCIIHCCVCVSHIHTAHIQDVSTAHILYVCYTLTAFCICLCCSKSYCNYVSLVFLISIKKQTGITYYCLNVSATLKDCIHSPNIRLHKHQCN